MRDILLRGRLRHGLYVLHVPPIRQASLLTHNSQKLHLLNVSSGSFVACSLLSVPQLTRANNVFAEFHRFYFC
jgi:hypothetical protein